MPPDRKGVYSRVPNTTIGNPYSFFGAAPSYMALFGTSRLLNFMKSSFLHFYSEFFVYGFFTFFHHFTIERFRIKYLMTLVTKVHHKYTIYTIRAPL